MRRTFLPLILGSLAVMSSGQLRVATYNISNYSGGRLDDLRTAFYAQFEGRSFRPDVLVAQEVLSQAALNDLVLALNTAAGSPGDWAAAPFINGPDTDNALVYRTSKLDFLAQTIVSAGGSAPEPPRHTLRYDVRLKGYSVIQPKIAIYSAHFKAGNTSADEARRLVEASRVRADAQALGSSFWGFAIGGDFNVYSSGDDAYTKLTQFEANDLGRFFDPISRPGSWDNSSTYRFIHTQDPVGAGGMDSRFDFVLLSRELTDGVGIDYVGPFGSPYGVNGWDEGSHSYRSWGNDGNTFNLAIATTGNTMVGPTIAQALQNLATGSGGHLPVFLDLYAPAEMGANKTTLDLGRAVQGASNSTTVNLRHATNSTLWGSAIAPLPWTASASGGFGLSASSGNFSAGQSTTVTVSGPTATPGTKNGSFTTGSSDPRVNSLSLPISLTVVPNQFPASGLTVLANSLIPIGGLAELAADDEAMLEAPFGVTGSRASVLDLELRADAQIDTVASLRFDVTGSTASGEGLVSVLAWDRVASQWVQVGPKQTLTPTEQTFSFSVGDPSRFLDGPNGSIKARLVGERVSTAQRSLLLRFDRFAFRITG